MLVVRVVPEERVAPRGGSAAQVAREAHAVEGVITMDLFPTLVELAGLPAAAGRGGQAG